MTIVATPRLSRALPACARVACARVACALIAGTMLACAFSACAERTDATALPTGDRRGERTSRAAVIPNVDVRRLPPERKAAVPDVMLRAADRGRTFGADSAAVQLFVISDLQCAACKQWHETQWPVIVRDYVQRGLVRMTFVFYPLREHPHAVLAGSAAMCASAQHQFWPAVDALFAAQSRWATDPAPERLIDSLAAVPGVDRRALRECTTSHRLWRQLRADVDWVDAAGDAALPVLVVGSRRLNTPTSLEQLRAALDSARAGR